MGVVEGFNKARSGAKLALMVLALTTLLVWIAFTCTGWAKITIKSDQGEQVYKIGLWRICNSDKLSPKCFQLDGWGLEWSASVQGFMTIGFIGINVAFLLIILYLFVPSCQKNREVTMATLLLCFVSGTSCLVGVIIFGVNFEDDYVEPSKKVPQGRFTAETCYCFVLSIVALILDFGAGGVIYYDSRKDNTDPSGQNEVNFDA